MPKTRSSGKPLKATLEALGRLMLSFTELDLVITMQLEVYIGCESEQLASVFIEIFDFPIR